MLKLGRTDLINYDIIVITFLFLNNVIKLYYFILIRLYSSNDYD